MPNSFAISTRSLISASSASCAPGFVKPVVPPALPVPTRLTHLRPVSCCAWIIALRSSGMAFQKLYALNPFAATARIRSARRHRRIAAPGVEHDLDVDRDRVRRCVRRDGFRFRTDARE